MRNVSFLLEKEAYYLNRTLESLIRVILILKRLSFKKFILNLPKNNKALNNIMIDSNINKTRLIQNNILYSIRRYYFFLVGYFTNYKISYKLLIKSVIISIFFIFLGYFSIFQYYIESELESGLRSINLMTSSMYPFIKPGSLVITSKESSYKVGDVITYKIDSEDKKILKTITHRVVGKQKYNDTIYIVTKGDFNRYPDPNLINIVNVLGKVIFVIPYIGYVFESIKTIPGFLLFVTIPTLFVLRDQLIFLFESRFK